LLPFDSDDPALSADGQTLYFTSWRPARWYRPLAHKERIWQAERRSAEGRRWTRPRPLSDAVNAMDLHWQFSVAESGALYFASQGDLYRAPPLGGQHATPQRLEAPVNSEHRENTPFVAPDESYLIFGSSRPQESRGMDDLYVSFRQASGTWSPAVNLGSEVNSSAHELCPRVSPDGRYLFFLSGRSGTYDAYWIETQSIEQLRSEDL
jgi:Tol biopolymer transport system component